MAEPFAKQVETPAQNPEMIALRKRIATLQIVYFALFALSLVLIVARYNVRGSNLDIAWAVALGAAVLTRVIRQTMVNKYNQLLAGGRHGPLT